MDQEVRLSAPNTVWIEAVGVMEGRDREDLCFFGHRFRNLLVSVVYLHDYFPLSKLLESSGNSGFGHAVFTRQSGLVDDRPIRESEVEDQHIEDSPGGGSEWIIGEFFVQAVEPERPRFTLRDVPLSAGEKNIYPSQVDSFSLRRNTIFLPGFLVGVDVLDPDPLGLLAVLGLAV